MLSLIIGIWILSRVLRPRWGWRYYYRPFLGWGWLLLALLFGSGAHRRHYGPHGSHGSRGFGEPRGPEGPYGFGGPGGWR